MKKSDYSAQRKGLIAGLVVLILLSFSGYLLFFNNSRADIDASSVLDYTKVNHINTKQFLEDYDYRRDKSSDKVDTLETIKYLSALELNCENFYKSSIFLAKTHLKNFRRGEALNELINLRIFVQKNCGKGSFSEIDFLIIRSLLRSWNPSSFEKERALSLAQFHFEEAQKKPKDSLYYNQALRSIYDTYRLINYDSARFYLEKIQEIVGEGEALRMRAYLERQFNNHEQELDFFQKVRELKGGKSDWDELGVAWRNLGECDKAFEILNTILENKMDVAKNTGPSPLMIPLINMGKWHVVCGDSTTGKNYLEQAMEIALDRKSSYHVDEILEFYKEHFLNHDDLMKYAIYLDRHYKQEQIQEALFKNLLFSINTAESKSSRQEKYIRYLLLMLILFGSGIFFFYWRSRGNQKKSLGNELKAMKHENDVAKLKLSKNTKDEFLNSSLRKLSSKVDKIRSTDQNVSKRLEELNKLIEEIRNDAFKEHEFDNLIKYWDPEFFKRLLEINPKLTQLDLKHCIFVVLNMNKIEVSKILNVAPETVNTHRYRLKQKLMIPEKHSLLSFLSDLFQKS